LPNYLINQATNNPIPPATYQHHKAFTRLQFSVIPNFMIETSSNPSQFLPPASDLQKFFEYNAKKIWTLSISTGDCCTMPGYLQQFFETHQNQYAH